MTEYKKAIKFKCEELNITEQDYNTFKELGKQLHHIYEDSCNGIIQTDEEYNNATLPLEKIAEENANELGLHIYFQTDPRGATIYLDKEPMNQTNYNRGYCIY